MPTTEQQQQATDTGGELSLRDLVMWRDPERLSGAPCFAGTRVPVSALFDYLEAGDSLNAFLDDFPGVTREQALGALRIGKARLLEEGGGDGEDGGAGGSPVA